MLNDTTIVQELITLIALVISFVIGRYILPKINMTTDTALKNLQIIEKYAAAFVIFAKEFYGELSGEDKLNEVVNKLKTIAENNCIDMKEEDLKAIAQKAYTEMKKGEESASSTTKSENTKKYKSIFFI